MYILMYGMSISLHVLPFNTKRYLLMMYVMQCIVMLCCIVMYCPIFAGVCYHYIIFFELSLHYMCMFVLASVFLLWMMTGMV